LRRQARRALITAVLAAAGAAGPSEVTLDVTFPPASFLNSSNSSRQGLSGTTFIGCFVAFPSNGDDDSFYIYFTHDDGTGRFVGVNPGHFEPSLAGFIGIEVQLPSGNRTGPQVATSAQETLDGAGITATVNSNVVSITGTYDVGTVFTGGSYDDAGGGTIDDQVPAIGGILGWTREDTASNSFAAASMRAQRFDNADLPPDPFRITGLESYWGDVHTGQGTFAIYQGGAGDFDFQGATLLGIIGTTAGSATDQWVRTLCTPDDVIEVDPANGNVWLVWAADAGATWNFEGSTSGRPSVAHYAVQAGTNLGIFLFNGGASGSGATFPATAPAVAGAGNSAFIGSFRLIIQRSPYYGDFTWKCRIGLNQTFAGAATSTMTGVFTANAYTVPDVLGIEADRTYVNYSAHDSGEQFRLEWWEGGTSDTNIAGAVKVWDAGQTSGTATGYVGIAAGASSFPLTPNARLWMSVKALSGNSTLRYGSGGIGYTDLPTPAVFFRGAATESEYVSPDGGFSHDPAVATATPLTPTGSNLNNNNAAGLYGIARVSGFNVQEAA
jgi:hypothetical protein